MQLPKYLRTRAGVILELGLLLPLLLMASIAVSQRLPSQQRITLCFLDSKTRKPMRNRQVHVVGYDSSVPFTSRFKKDEKTDRNGRVTVEFGDRLPERIAIMSELWQSLPDYSPEQILNTGIVVPFTRTKDGLPTFTVPPEPGTITIINERITLWDRMRQEIP